MRCMKVDWICPEIPTVRDSVGPDGTATTVLENRCALRRTVGSNPTPSARFVRRISNLRIFACKRTFHELLPIGRCCKHFANRSGVFKPSVRIAHPPPFMPAREFSLAQAGHPIVQRTRAFASRNRTAEGAAWPQFGGHPFSAGLVSPNPLHLLNCVRINFSRKITGMGVARGASVRLPDGYTIATGI